MNISNNINQNINSKSNLGESNNLIAESNIIIDSPKSVTVSCSAKLNHKFCGENFAAAVERSWIPKCEPCVCPYQHYDKKHPKYIKLQNKQHNIKPLVDKTINKFSVLKPPQNGLENINNKNFKEVIIDCNEPHITMKKKTLFDGNFVKKLQIDKSRIMKSKKPSSIHNEGIIGDKKKDNVHIPHILPVRQFLQDKQNPEENSYTSQSKIDKNQTCSNILSNDSEIDCNINEFNYINDKSLNLNLHTVNREQDQIIANKDVIDENDSFNIYMFPTTNSEFIHHNSMLNSNTENYKLVSSNYNSKKIKKLFSSLANISKCNNNLNMQTNLDKIDNYNENSPDLDLVDFYAGESMRDIANIKSDNHNSMKEVSDLNIKSCKNKTFSNLNKTNRTINNVAKKKMSQKTNDYNKFDVNKIKISNETDFLHNFYLSDDDESSDLSDSGFVGNTSCNKFQESFVNNIPFENKLNHLTHSNYGTDNSLKFYYSSSPPLMSGQRDGVISVQRENDDKYLLNGINSFKKSSNNLSSHYLKNKNIECSKYNIQPSDSQIENMKFNQYNNYRTNMNLDFRNTNKFNECNNKLNLQYAHQMKNNSSWVSIKKTNVNVNKKAKDANTYIGSSVDIDDYLGQSSNDELDETKKLKTFKSFMNGLNTERNADIKRRHKNCSRKVFISRRHRDQSIFSNDQHVLLNDWQNEYNKQLPTNLLDMNLDEEIKFNSENQQFLYSNYNGNDDKELYSNSYHKSKFCMSPFIPENFEGEYSNMNSGRAYKRESVWYPNTCPSTDSSSLSEFQSEDEYDYRSSRNHPQLETYSQTYSPHTCLLNIPDALNKKTQTENQFQSPDNLQSPCQFQYEPKMWNYWNQQGINASTNEQVNNCNQLNLKNKFHNEYKLNANHMGQFNELICQHCLHSSSNVLYQNRNEQSGFENSVDSQPTSGFGRCLCQQSAEEFSFEGDDRPCYFNRDDHNRSSNYYSAVSWYREHVITSDDSVYSNGGQSYRDHEYSFSPSSLSDADDEFECDCELCKSLAPGNRPHGNRIRLEPRNNIIREYEVNDPPTENNVFTDWLRAPLDALMQEVMDQMNLEFDFESMSPRAAAPPISSQDFELLPYETAIDDESFCSICLSKFDSSSACKDGLVKKLPCSHIFHEECIKTWLTKTGSCPICRAIIPTSPTII